MAWEVPGTVFTLPATTGLVQYRFVTVNTSGQLAHPVAGAPVLGVTYDAGTTGSTRDSYLSVQVSGVAKVWSTASTVAKGDLVSTTTAGRLTAVSAGSYAVGMVVDGSSGSARLLSVALLPIGTT